MPRIVETVEHGLVAWNAEKQLHVKMIKKDGNYLWIKSSFSASDVRFMYGVGYVPDAAIVHYGFNVESELSWARNHGFKLEKSNIVSVEWID